MLHNIILDLHNWVRWVVIILGSVAFGLALSGWLGKRPWTEQMGRFGSFFGISTDIQLLLGLILYFISPAFGVVGLTNLGVNREISFFALEHPISMILAVVFAHLGAALPRRVDDPRKKYLRAAIFFGLAVLFILFAIPWGRPLFRI